MKEDKEKCFKVGEVLPGTEELLPSEKEPHIPKLIPMELKGGKPSKPLTGGPTWYYRSKVLHPYRKGDEPYEIECKDIILSLRMERPEGEIQKSLWRLCKEMLGKGKGNGCQYELEKIADSLRDIWFREGLTEEHLKKILQID